MFRTFAYRELNKRLVAPFSPLSRNGINKTVFSSNLRFLSQYVITSKVPFSMDQIKPNLCLGKFLLDPVSNNDSSTVSIDSIAYIDGFTGESYSFKQVHDISYKIASALKKIGFDSNTSGAAIISPNHITFAPLIYGISLTSGYVISVNPLSSLDDIHYQLDLGEAKVVFCHSLLLDKVASVANKLGLKVIVMDKAVNNYPSLDDFIKNESADRNTIQLFESVNHSLDHTAVVPFSSGTTGKSKGVVLTNRNIISNILQAIPNEGVNLQKSKKTGLPGVAIVPLPFFHIYGMVLGQFMTYYLRAKTVFLPNFDFIKFLELIGTYKVTRGYIVPPIVIALAKHPVVKNYDLSSLEALVSGAAPLGADIQELCFKRLNVIVKQGWGMTELSPLGTVSSDEDSLNIDSIKGKAGILVGGTEAKIVDVSSGVDIPASEEGEVLIRGPQVMKEYLKNEQATKSTIRPDGWLHTGDVGYFDNEGNLVITDRCKELIKYKGYQVPPAELEAILLGMPQIQDAVVIPVLDDEAGEIPRAYVVRQPNCPSSFTEEDVIQYVNSRVAPQKKLRGGVVFANSIPKSPSGKLLRRVQIAIDRGQAVA